MDRADHRGILFWVVCRELEGWHHSLQVRGGTTCLSADTKQLASYRDPNESQPNLMMKPALSVCRLINRIKPGSVHKINEPATMPFKKMENIANYLKGVRALGMKEFQMFGTPDLFEEKNLAQVCGLWMVLRRWCCPFREFSWFNLHDSHLLNELCRWSSPSTRWAAWCSLSCPTRPSPSWA